MPQMNLGTMKIDRRKKEEALVLKAWLISFHLKKEIIGLNEIRHSSIINDWPNLLIFDWCMTKLFSYTCNNSVQLIVKLRSIINSKIILTA